MNFRETLPSDPAASRLLNAYFEHRALGFTGAQGYKTVFPDDRHFASPHGVFLVVEIEGEPVGCGGIRHIESPERGERWFEVKHLWVEPKGRGQGRGKQLLHELETRAIDFGATHAVLDTNASLAAAGGLYVSAGYLTIEPYNDNPNATNWYKKLLPR